MPTLLAFALNDKLDRVMMLKDNRGFRVTTRFTADWQVRTLVDVMPRFA